MKRKLLTTLIIAAALTTLGCDNRLPTPLEVTTEDGMPVEVKISATPEMKLWAETFANPHGAFYELASGSWDISFGYVRRTFSTDDGGAPDYSDVRLKMSIYENRTKDGDLVSITLNIKDIGRDGKRQRNFKVLKVELTHGDINNSKLLLQTWDPISEGVVGVPSAKYQDPQILVLECDWHEDERILFVSFRTWLGGLHTTGWKPTAGGP